ncbi:hypothetical protein A3J19_01985 [Candidatus Daviesbacteria bacterium RIFCSPLOWO2_02_FULL_41_8]|uniref:Steroid 5-alpha reductase C-terminal domain-containing protein n=2 Tax=Candidatus Daviesiibacteriota TaxID=1752718 RepID=A0A1F5NID5_9BACT|nr:MAG: hypothetical protein A2871_03260 [Candidatus Daviesbacteria bacterium RIFCSPHIGHO2_01_FULL_41_23]OGE61946.1 MAG: hypothetical protein A2967_03075 [Candidatus Daviesbacteria bacterium RIFCSPLOWO2_01_FULL_41_32]OGE77395.1 MAG: hypothetical protein A3J19_01985 [Candidatus Daviesbacteria bacterium RIFCSPLOWO2_02_FULL_41_8]
MFLVILLTIFVIPLVWAFTDPRTSKEKFKNFFRLKTMAFSFVEALIIATTFLSAIFFPWPNIPFSSLITVIGLIAYLLGLYLAVWAKLTMKSVWGTPAEHNIKRQNKIIQKGPFVFSRNPIYLGFILTVLGSSLVLKSYSILFVPFMALYFYKAVLKEEKILAKYFGKEYLEYKSRVRRFI